MKAEKPLVDNFQKKSGNEFGSCLPSVYPDQICKGVADVLDCPDIPNGVGSPSASSWILDRRRGDKNAFAFLRNQISSRKLFCQFGKSLSSV